MGDGEVKPESKQLSPFAKVLLASPVPERQTFGVVDLDAVGPLHQIDLTPVDQRAPSPVAVKTSFWNCFCSCLKVAVPPELQTTETARI